MATSVAKIQAELDLDTGKFSGSITSAIGKVKSFNTSVSKADKSLDDIRRRVTGLGASLRDTMVVLGQFQAAMHTLWTFTGRWVGAIVEANAKLERLQQLMKGLSRSADEAGRVADSLRDMNYVMDRAKNAPFTIDAIADSFVKMRAAGIDPTTGGLQSLMDGVARFGGTSEQLHRATIAIQQMAGKGVVSMEELRQQLGEAVPNAMQLMARATGMTMAEMVKTISTGRLAFDKVLQDKFFFEMQMEFAGASENMMDTWVGLTQKLKTEWMIFAKEIGNQGLFDSAKQALRDLMAFMSSSDGKSLARDIGVAIGEAIKMASELARWLITNRDEIVTWGRLLAQVFVAKQITSFGFALASTGVAVVNWTRTLGGLTTAMAAARAGTIGWTAAIGAAAGPIGIAITAIGTLVMWLYNQERAARAAADEMNRYYAATDQGKSVTPEEHAAMRTRLDYLNRVNVAIAEANARDKGSSYARKRHDSTLTGLLSEGRELGLIDDGGNAFTDAFEDLNTKITRLSGMAAANITRAMDGVAKQTSIQSGQMIEKTVADYGSRLAKAAEKGMPQISGQLEDIARRMTEGKLSPEQAQVERAGIIGGALDAKVRVLEAGRKALQEQLTKAAGDERQIAAIGLLMEENNKQLEAVRTQRATLAMDVNILPAMNGMGDKKKTDEFLDLFQSLSGKAAQLQAQLDGGMPKLERFRELVRQGEYEGNSGLIGGIERLYEAIDALEKKVAAQRATETLTNTLDEMAAKASADVISAQLDASGDLYSKVASGMVGFNREVAVMRANLHKTNMTSKEFEERIAAIRVEISKMDRIRFAEFARDRVFENWTATLPEKERRLADFNRQLREYENLRTRMKEGATDAEAKEVDGLFNELAASETARFQYENRSSWELWIDQYKDTTEEMNDVWGDALDGMARNMTDMLTTGKADWSSFATHILKEITRILVSKALAQLAEYVVGIFGGVSGYSGGSGMSNSTGYTGGKNFTKSANGNIMTSAGPAKLNFYEKGGIANSPQLSLFGEGRTPEAYVPLPDGRSIPVTMDGAGGGTMVQNSVSIEVNIKNDGSGDSDTQSNTKAGEELAKTLNSKIKQVMSDEMRPGGILWRMANG